MLTWIYGKRILTPERIVDDPVVIIEDSRIKAIESRSQVSQHPEHAQVIDASQHLVIPGLIDIHVHGSAGYDVMDATPGALQAMSAFLAEHGVTAFLATTITQSNPAIAKAIENVLEHREEVSGAYPLGVHLEGPYLNRDYRGAQPQEFLRNPDPLVYEAWLETGMIRKFTVAPELPGAMELIQTGKQHGSSLSAGHTGASFAQLEQAADAGLSQSTHTFNGMPGLHHREPGILGAILSDDRITCEVIADGIHVHPAILKVLVRVKGIERVVLVSDAIRAAGLGDGDYDLGGQLVTVDQHIARTKEGGLAGSTLTLERAVWNMVHMGEVSVQQAVRMATLNAANAAGHPGKKGVLAPGADADITIVDPDFSVRLTMVAGRVVYRRENNELKETIQ